MKQRVVRSARHPRSRSSNILRRAVEATGTEFRTASWGKKIVLGLSLLFGSACALILACVVFVQFLPASYRTQGKGEDVPAMLAKERQAKKDQKAEYERQKAAFAKDVEENGEDALNRIPPLVLQDIEKAQRLAEEGK